MADDSGWLMVAEIARRLGRGDSTVSYWRKIFRDVLEERRDRDGHPTYSLAAFRQIAALRDQKASPTEIRRQLAAGSAPQPTTEIDLLREILAELRGLRDDIKRLADELRGR